MEPDDILVRITAHNRGPEAAPLHLLPTLWFRNTWSWKGGAEAGIPRPSIRLMGKDAVSAEHARMGKFNLLAAAGPGKAEGPHWDLAFHTLPFALIDPEFARQQLHLMLREWYMAPSGQLAAYEYDFGDVNPPVHAWACPFASGSEGGDTTMTVAPGK